MFSEHSFLVHCLTFLALSCIWFHCSFLRFVHISVLRFLHQCLVTCSTYLNPPYNMARVSVRAWIASACFQLMGGLYSSKVRIHWLKGKNLCPDVIIPFKLQVPILCADELGVWWSDELALAWGNSQLMCAGMMDMLYRDWRDRKHTGQPCMQVPSHKGLDTFRTQGFNCRHAHGTSRWHSIKTIQNLGVCPPPTMSSPS